MLRKSFSIAGAVALIGGMVILPSAQEALQQHSVQEGIVVTLMSVKVHRKHTPFTSTATYKIWAKVDQCEAGSVGHWLHWTWWYPDGLGIDRPNFIQFGGNPNRVNSIIQQIRVGMKFVAYYHMPIPDQNGYCYPY